MHGWVVDPTAVAVFSVEEVLCFAVLYALLVSRTNIFADVASSFVEWFVDMEFTFTLV